MKIGFVVLFNAVLYLGMLGCSIPNPIVEASDEEGYFSIQQFLDDQWKIMQSSPYVLLRVSQYKGKTDSGYIELTDSLWHTIRVAFDKTDISSVKYKDTYRFGHLTDKSLQTNQYTYQSIEDKNWVKQLFITTDMYSEMIKSIFIQAQENNGNYQRQQKLTYIPQKYIQIQSEEKSWGLDPQQLTITYYFEY